MYAVGDTPECELGRPMQLIRRDRFGKTIEVLDIFGPDEMKQGVVLLEGYMGLYHAPRTVVTDQTAFGDGAIPTEWPRVEMRPVEFTLGTQAESAEAWERIENRLWRFLKFNQDVYLRVHSVLSEPRELKIRLQEKPNDLLNKGPGLIKVGIWKIVAVAYDPWFYSATITDSIKRSDMVEVNGTTGLPQAGTGIWQGNVDMFNPADQECWPEFSSNELTAPAKFWLPDGIDGPLIPINDDGNMFGAGKEFYFRSDPMVPNLLVRDGSQEWANMPAGAFNYKIEPGVIDPVPRPIRIQGGTADTEVKVYLIQKWDRMFGGEVERELADVDL
jgi:hypothetical protein